MSYLKKILGELAMVLDQIEAELEKRKLENEGGCLTSGEGVSPPACPTHYVNPQPLSPRDRSHSLASWLGSGAGESGRPKF